MMKMARRIALLCGGASGEREVSLLSAAAVEEALEKRYEVIKIDTGVEGWAHTLLDSSAVRNTFLQLLQCQIHNAPSSSVCVHVTVSVHRKITDDLRQKAPQCPRPLRRNRIPCL